MTTTTNKRIVLDQQNHLKLREDFVILKQRSQNNCELVYLDNAATTQKPESVINTINEYYHRHNANVHRGVHFLSDRATNDFEQARSMVKHFINAHSSREVIWTGGATSAINLIANSYGSKFLRKGDLIVLSHMEHHANIVPWQIIAKRTGAIIEPIRLTEHHKLDTEHYKTLLERKPKIVSVCHASNALGTINPINDIIAMAKQVGAITIIDGAQAISHTPVDVQTLDCDFYVFSGHKLFGPTGIGVLYGKEGILNDMPPWQGGGEMINRVSFEHTSYNDIPYKFEAGTPNIAGAIGMGAAIGYINQYDQQSLIEHKQQLFIKLYDFLAAHDKIEIYSPKTNNVGIIAFNIEGEHHQDIGTLLDQQGIAVRTGHHCAMPLMTQLGINGTIRVSLSIYNNDNDLKAFINGLSKVLEMLT